MNRWLRTAALLGAIAAWQVWEPSAAPRAWGAQASSKSPRLATVTLVVRHRVFPDFVDVQTVKLNQEFPVGDSEFTGRVVQYVPDFAMDTKTGKVVSRTGEPKNPAFKIIVKQNKTAQDTTWAMLNMIPHFARKSMLAFRVARIDFIGHEPIVGADSTAHAPPPATAPSHSTDKQTGKAPQ